MRIYVPSPLGSQDFQHEKIAENEIWKDLRKLYKGKDLQRKNLENPKQIQINHLFPLTKAMGTAQL